MTEGESPHGRHAGPAGMTADPIETRAGRAEVYQRLTAVERQGDRLQVTVVETGKATDRRLDSLETSLAEHRREGKKETMSLEGKAEKVREDLDAAARKLEEDQAIKHKEVLSRFEAGKITLLKALAYSTPISVPLILNLLQKK